jgi:hypothetical protein
MKPRDTKSHPSTSALELVLSEPPGAEPRGILVFPHLPGVGADDLTAAVLDSMPGGCRRMLPAPPLGASDSVLRAWHRDAWMAASEQTHGSIVLATGPTAAYLAAAVGDAAETLALVREPLAVLPAADPAGPPKRRLLQALVDEPGGVPGERLRPWSNPQSRALLGPWHDTHEMEVTAGPPADADRWREMLFEDVLTRVAVTHDPLAAARTLADRLGSRRKRAVRAATALAAPSPARPDAAEDERLVSLAWLDTELYERCLGSEADSGLGGS